jgi:hypothetical protein
MRLLSNRLYAVAIQKRYQDQHYWEVFPQTLHESALEDWYNLYEELENEEEESKELFDIVVKKFIAVYFHEGTRHHWIECIRKFSAQDKPAGMSTLRLVNRLKTIKHKSKLLPSDDGEEVTDKMLRDAVYHTASQHDQAIITRRFRGDYTKATLEELQMVLTVEERIQSTFRKKLEDKNLPKVSKKKTARKKKQVTKVGNSEKGTKSVIKYGPKAKCLRHPNGTHTWGDCRFNPQSANYDPNTAHRGNNDFRSNQDNHRNNQGNTHGNQNNNQGNQHHNHGRSTSYGGPTHQGSYYHQAPNYHAHPCIHNTSGNPGSNTSRSNYPPGWHHHLE